MMLTLGPKKTKYALIAFLVLIGLALIICYLTTEERGGPIDLSDIKEIAKGIGITLPDSISQFLIYTNIEEGEPAHCEIKVEFSRLSKSSPQAIIPGAQLTGFVSTSNYKKWYDIAPIRDGDYCFEKVYRGTRITGVLRCNGSRCILYISGLVPVKMFTQEAITALRRYEVSPPFAVGPVGRSYEAYYDPGLPLPVQKLVHGKSALKTDEEQGQAGNGDDVVGKK